MGDNRGLCRGSATTWTVLGLKDPSTLIVCASNDRYGVCSSHCDPLVRPSVLIDDRAVSITRSQAIRLIPLITDGDNQPSTISRRGPQDASSWKQVNFLSETLTERKGYILDKRLTQASSVAISLVSTNAHLSATQRKRMQAWFLGLSLCEGASIRNIGNLNLDGIVRRTVPSGTFVFCGKDTRVILEEPEDQKNMDENKIGEPSANVFQDILDRFISPEKYVGFEKYNLPKGILLHGPPGVGKSHSVRELEAALKKLGVPTCFQAPSPGILSDRVNGSSTLKDCFRKAVVFASEFKNGVSVIFLDELDSYAFSRSDHDTRLNLTAALLVLMDGFESKSEVNNIIVIGATNRVNSLDSALRRPGRFDHEVSFRLPNEEERYQFVISLLGQHPDTTKAASFIAAHGVGYAFADIVAVLRRCNEHFALVETIRLPAAAALRDATNLSPAESRPQVVAHTGVYSILQRAIEWPLLKSNNLNRMGLSQLYRGILLYGPPGCGKTSLVLSVIGQMGRKVGFYSLSGADVYSSGFGDAEAYVRQAFAKARQTSPCVLFFDEIDSLVGSRENGMGSSTSVQGRVLSTFLNEMDGVSTSSADGLLIIGATNSPEGIDKALMRPGRFDKLIFVGPADPRAVLETEIAKMNVIDSINLEALALEATGMSGADIVGACQRATMRAFSRSSCSKPCQEDFLVALREGSKSCTPDILLRYEHFAKSYSA